MFATSHNYIHNIHSNTEDTMSFNGHGYGYSFMESFFIAFGTIQLGLLFGFISTAYIYNSYRKQQLKYYNSQENHEYGEENMREEKYEERYPVQKKNNDDIEVECSNIPNKNSYIIEQTPEGMVIMNYDEDNDGFQYWCDGNVRFSYLETVARKYVKSFECENLYYERACNKKYNNDNDNELEVGDVNIDSNHGSNYNSENEETDEKTENNDENHHEHNDDINGNNTKKNSPFATLKKYNNTSQNNHQNISINNSNITNNNITNNINEENQSCKFIKIGKICDFNVIKCSEKKETITDSKQKLDFKTFKELFME